MNLSHQLVDCMQAQEFDSVMCTKRVINYYNGTIIIILSLLRMSLNSQAMIAVMQYLSHYYTAVNYGKWLKIVDHYAACVQ